MKGIDFLMKKNKIIVFYGYGFFINVNIINVVKVDGSNEMIEIDKVIIVIGFKFIMFVVFNYDKNRVIILIEVLNIEDVFKSMVIIGGGVIGLEFGFVYVRLGLEIYVVEYMDWIFLIMDKDCLKELMCVMKKLGVKFYVKYMVIIVKVNKKSVIVEV